MKVCETSDEKNGSEIQEGIQLAGRNVGRSAVLCVVRSESKETRIGSEQLDVSSDPGCSSKPDASLN